MKLLENEFERLQDKVTVSKQITSIRIPSSGTFYVYKHYRVLRLRSTDWRSSLNTVVCD